MQRVQRVAAVVGLLFAFRADLAMPESFTTNTNAGLSAAGFPAPEVTEAIRQRLKKSQPLFVIVPGILGSKLLKGSTVLWGKNPLTRGQHPKELLYEGTEADAQFLSDFHALGINFDFYGQLRDHLKFFDFSVNECIEFPYDWRIDIRVAATRLNQFIFAHQKEFEGRRVIFLAHSMGGLVVRWWYWKLYANSPREYGFAGPPEVFFIATPQYGSAAALYQLVQGYGAGEGKEGRLLDHLMHDINVEAYSYPSMYQLTSLNSHAVSFQHSHQPETNVDIFNYRLWDQCHWGSELRAQLAEKHPEKDGEFYSKFIAARLDAAREFHQQLLELDKDAIPGSICFFSTKIQTPALLRIRQSGREKCVVEIRKSLGGDGRVISEVGFDRQGNHKHEQVQKLIGEHAALQHHEVFMARIDELRDDLEAAETAFVAQDAPRRSDLVRAFYGEHVLLPVPLDFKRRTEKSTKAIIDFDRSVLRLAFGDLDDEELAHALYKTIPHDNERRSNQSNRLYAIVASLAPDSEWAVYSANNLAANLLENDRWNDALSFTAHAVNFPPDDLSDVRIEDRLHLNHARALYHLEHYCEARGEYLRSHDSKASPELKRMEAELHEHGIPCGGIALLGGPD